MDKKRPKKMQEVYAWWNYLVLKFQDIVDYLRTCGHEVDIVDVYKIDDDNSNNFGGSRVQGIAVDSNHIITANNDRRKDGEVAGH